MLKLINSILILLTLTSFVSCDVEEFTVQELNQLHKALDESLQYMKKEVKEEDAVIFVGATRSGKSTLINYLIGNALVAERVSRSQPITIRKVDPLSKGPEIGRGSTSKTIIPSRWISAKLPQMVIWDSPGFDDNRGPVQDITNAFYLYQVLQKVKTLRIVLAVDINDLLRDNIQPFLSVLNAVEDLLGHENKTHASILSVIFTKAPEYVYDDIPLDKQLLNDILLEQVIRSNMSLSQTTRDIVNFLIRNNNHIAFFKKAKLGLVTSAIDVNIFPAIMQSSPLGRDILKELRPRISDASKICLFKSKDALLPKNAFKDLEDAVRLVIDKKVHDFESISNTQEAENKIKIHITQLEEIERLLIDAITHEFGFYKKMEIIQSIDADIEKEVQKHNLLEKIELMKFIDKLLGMEESNVMEYNLETVILSSESKVRRALTNARLKQGQITEQKYNEYLKKEQKKHAEEMESLRKKIEKSVEQNKKASNPFKTFLATVNPLAGIIFSAVDYIQSKSK